MVGRGVLRAQDANQKLENAKINPRLSTLVRVADVLDLPLRELMDIS